MPSLKELLKDAGVDLPAELDLSNIIEQSDEVKGLATAKADLQNWKLENKPLLEKLQADSEANQKAVEDAIKEKMDAAKKANDLESYLNAEKELRETAEKALNTTREGVKNAVHEKALSEISNWFSDSLVGKSFARGLAKTDLNESGDAVTTFKLGDVDYSDIALFKDALSKDKGYGAHMKAANSSGPQFTNTNANNGNPDNKKSAAEILYS